jgi:hypothetical protein
MTLPPLPLVNGCLFLDNSTMEVLDTCERAGEYLFIRKRKSAEEKSALSFGGGMHLALEYRYRHCPDGITGTFHEQRQVDLLTLWFRDHPPTMQCFRTLDLATKLVLRYNKVYYAEPFKTLIHNDNGVDKPLIEVPFAHELCTIKVPFEVHETGYVRIIYTGRIDLPIIEDGRIWTLDHKTTAIMGAGFWDEQKVSPQHEGYCWAWWKSSGQLPAGYIVNALRTRKPLKRDSEGVATRAKKQREDVEDDDFQRDRTHIDEARLEEWRNNLIQKIKGFLWHYSQGYMPQKKKWCVGKYGKCQFYDVCGQPSEFRAITLGSDLFTDQTWNPLTADRKLDDYLKELETDRDAIEKARGQIAKQVEDANPFAGSEYE